MKLIRWIFYASLVICLVMGLYSGVRIYFLFFLTGILIICAVLAINIFTIYSFKFTQKLARNLCEKGETTELILELINESIVPLSLLNVHIEVVSPHRNVNLIFNLAPFSGKRFQIPLELPYRGHYKVGMTTIRINDIFGLVPFRFDMRRLPYYRMKEILVLPKAVASKGASVEMPDAKSFGEVNLKLADFGDSMAGARLYRPGDTAKRIHWKKSIQLSNLYSKQYDFPERENITIVLDSSAQGLLSEDLMRYADTLCECAASVALHSLLRGRSIQLVFSGYPNESIFCENIRKFDDLRKKLALLIFDSENVLVETFSSVLSDSTISRELFVLTRHATPELISIMEKALERQTSLTLMIVGGTLTDGRIHTLFVKDGGNVAESLSAAK